MNLLEKMPPFWAADPALAGLMRAINAAVNDYLADVQMLLHSGAVSTAESPWLERWEMLYGTGSVSGTQASDRRAAILFKARSRGICTEAKIRNVLAAVYSGEIEIDEDPEHSTITVRFVGQEGSPDFVDTVLMRLRAMIPAHLILNFEFEHLSIDEVEQLTLADLQQTELYHFAGGTY